MNRKYIIAVVVILFFLISANVFADKSSVAIEVPENITKGSVVTIKVTVTHSGNNFMHYTNWVYVNVNGKEIARWDFSWNNKPENEAFTREVKYTIEEPVTIEAEANCNMHGSKGKATKKIEL